MNLVKKRKHNEITKEISRELGYDERIVRVVIRSFFNSLRSLMKRNEEVNIPGLFSLKLFSSYKKRILKEGKNTNLRKRKNYTKKSKK